MTKQKHETYYSGGEVVGSMDRSWDVQKAPYKHPLYLNYTLQRIIASHDTQNPRGTWNTGHFFGSPNVVDAGNRAYDSLTSQLGDQATWANNLLEAGQSVATVEKRAMQLVGFAAALSRGHFGKAANILSMQNPFKKNRAPWKPGKPSPNKETFGDAWLEYHFGWEPAVKDVGAAASNMANADFGQRVIRGSGTSNQGSQWTDNVTDGFGTFDASFSLTDFVHMKYVTKSRITNPNSFLANQLGFANPLAVAWEAVPYSFVVDWFVNVGQCLNAMTGFVGVELSESYVTSFRRASWSEEHFAAPNSPYPDGAYSRNYGQTVLLIQCSRQPGSIPGPSLAVKPFKGFSPERAATAISLLTQFL